MLFFDYVRLFSFVKGERRRYGETVYRLNNITWKDGLEPPIPQCLVYIAIRGTTPPIKTIIKKINRKLGRYQIIDADISKTIHTFGGQPYAN